MGCNVSIDDIDLYAVDESAKIFVNDEVLRIIKQCNEEDLLSYGVLCEYAK